MSDAYEATRTRGYARLRQKYPEEWAKVRAEQLLRDRDAHPDDGWRRRSHRVESRVKQIMRERHEGEWQELRS